MLEPTWDPLHSPFRATSPTQGLRKKPSWPLLPVGSPMKTQVSEDSMFPPERITRQCYQGFSRMFSCHSGNKTLTKALKSTSHLCERCSISLFYLTGSRRPMSYLALLAYQLLCCCILIICFQEVGMVVEVEANEEHILQWVKSKVSCRPF